MASTNQQALPTTLPTQVSHEEPKQDLQSLHQTYLCALDTHKQAQFQYKRTRHAHKYAYRRLVKLTDEKGAIPPKVAKAARKILRAQPSLADAWNEKGRTCMEMERAHAAWMAERKRVALEELRVAEEELRVAEKKIRVLEEKEMTAVEEES